MAKKIQNKGDKARRKVGKVLKRNIFHMWHDADTNSQDVYHGRLLNIKKKNSAIYKVFIGNQMRMKMMMVLSTMTKYQLSADIINGYMVIL